MENKEKDHNTDQAIYLAGQKRELLVSCEVIEFTPNFYGVFPEDHYFSSLQFNLLHVVEPNMELDYGGQFVVLNREEYVKFLERSIECGESENYGESKRITTEAVLDNMMLESFSTSGDLAAPYIEQAITLFKSKVHRLLKIKRLNFNYSNPPHTDEIHTSYLDS